LVNCASLPVPVSPNTAKCSESDLFGRVSEGPSLDMLEATGAFCCACCAGPPASDSAKKTIVTTIRFITHLTVVILRKSIGEVVNDQAGFLIEQNHRVAHEVIP